MTAQFRVSDGSTFQVESFSTQATAFRASLLVEYDDGEQAPFEVSHTPNSDRTSATSPFPGRVSRDATVISALLESAALKRGQCFARIQVLDASGNQIDELNAGYVTATKSVRLGEFEDSLSRRGFLEWRAVASDVAPVTITEVLAATNAFRRVYGYVWYYHADDTVASRILRVHVRAPGTSIPTGFSIAEIVSAPNDGNLTLTADEEGIAYAYNSGRGDGFASLLDNGTLTQSDTASAPIPFPLEVPEDDLIEILFTPTAAEATDRHSIFISQEEWIDV